MTLAAQARLGLTPLAGSRTARLFLVFLGVCLAGYAYLGRGFAYAGLPPLYVDFPLFLLALVAVAKGLRPGMLRDLSVLLLLFYMAWGAVRAVPYLREFGLDALRDGVVWGWGIFALAVLAAGRGIRLDATAGRWYAPTMRSWPLLAVPALVAVLLAREALPRWPWGPGGGVPVVSAKGGDFGVHLAGLLAFLSLGLGARFGWGRQGSAAVAASVLPLFLLVASLNRGGFVAALAATAFLFAHLRPRQFAIALWGCLAAVSLLLLMAAADVEFDVGRPRTVSAQQLADNLASVFGLVDDPALTGTRQWRLDWWREIWEYTVDGPYFWTGKGFGINLADDDGFQVLADRSLRSPHNGHMTILARAGVPGLMLWTAWNATLLGRLWLSHWRHRRRGDEFGAAVRLWVVVFLVAALVNATFDVYLEGPMGGIWYWSVAGFGLWLLWDDRGTGYRRGRSSPYTRRAHASEGANGNEGPSHPQPLPATRR